MVRSEAERCTSVCGALRRATPGRLGLSHAAPRRATPRHAAPRRATPRRRAKAAALCTVQCTLHGASYHAEQIGLDPFIEGCWTHRLPWCTVQVCRESLRMRALPQCCYPVQQVSSRLHASRVIAVCSIHAARCMLSVVSPQVALCGSAHAARCIAHAVSVCPQQRAIVCLYLAHGHKHDQLALRRRDHRSDTRIRRGHSRVGARSQILRARSNLCTQITALHRLTIGRKRAQCTSGATGVDGTCGTLWFGWLCASARRRYDTRRYETIRYGLRVWFADRRNRVQQVLQSSERPSRVHGPLPSAAARTRRSTREAARRGLRR